MDILEFSIVVLSFQLLMLIIVSLGFSYRPTPRFLLNFSSRYRKYSGNNIDATLRRTASATQKFVKISDTFSSPESWLLRADST